MITDLRKLRLSLILQRILEDSFGSIPPQTSDEERGENGSDFPIECNAIERYCVSFYFDGN